MSLFEIAVIVSLVLIASSLMSIARSVNTIKGEVNVMFKRQHDKPPWYMG